MENINYYFNKNTVDNSNSAYYRYIKRKYYIMCIIYIIYGCRIDNL